MRALITVSDKTNVGYLAKELANLNIKIISTGGTYKELLKLGINVSSVEQYTNSKEILSGRVKTLHPKIYGGILAIRNNKEHTQDLKTNKIENIDIVVVNLYPFESITADENVSLDRAIESIDIGGVTLLRATAKNYRYTTVVCEPNDYGNIIGQLKDNGFVDERTRYTLALKAFKKTALYDNVIYKYLYGRKI